MPDVSVEQLAPRLWVVRRALPMRVEPVNCYVGLAGADDDVPAATIIDAGVAVHAERDWAHALQEIGLAPGHVAQVVVTHFHPDHIGGAAALQRITGAPVRATQRTVQQSHELWGAGLDDWIARATQHLIEHGMPPDRAGTLASERDVARALVELPGDFREIGEGDTVSLDEGATWVVLATPGHADGHLCLYDGARRWLICGDHLLARISPAVGLYPGHSPDPLADYLRSLERTEQLPIDQVLPGHGEPFAGGQARSRELLAHHDARVGECLRQLRDGPRTAWEVANAVFGRRDDPADERFALAETLAHLEYARRYDRIDRARGADGCWRYHLPA